jgi:hypothetical protein
LRRKDEDEVQGNQADHERCDSLWMCQPAANSGQSMCEICHHKYQCMTERGNYTAKQLLYHLKLNPRHDLTIDL